MEVASLDLADLFLIKPKIFHDSRGYFFESFQAENFAKHFFPIDFVQDNVSYSRENVLRGLHFQTHPGQDKLVYCSSGKIWDVAVDLRRDSKTFGKWTSVILDDENNHMIFIPKGFAHGFCVLSPFAKVHYKVSSYYNPETEKSVIWNDPDLAISWPIKSPILSDKDHLAPRLKQVMHFL